MPKHYVKNFIVTIFHLNAEAGTRQEYPPELARVSYVRDGPQHDLLFYGARFHLMVNTVDLSDNGTGPIVIAQRKKMNVCEMG